MTAALYIVIMLITFYMGGVYRNTPLIVLSFAEAAFFVLMLITAFISVSCIKTHFKKNMSYGYKNTEFKIPISVVNKSAFPINKAAICYRYFYVNKKENKAKKATFVVDVRSENTVNISVMGKYCGILKVNTYKVKAGDYFSIFFLSHKLQESADVLIMPEEKAIKIQKSSNIYFNDISDKAHDSQGDSQEINQIRPYRSGDSFKNIHWNISARTDELYYKEFTDTGRETIRLFIDIKSRDIADLKRTDAFYELCSAVILGLLENMGNADVYWKDNENIKNITVSNKNQVQSVLTELYYSKIGENGYSPDTENSFVLNCDLELYFGNKLIYKFSEENYEEEIMTSSFIL